MIPLALAGIVTGIVILRAAITGVNPLAAAKASLSGSPAPVPAKPAGATAGMVTGGAETAPITGTVPGRVADAPTSTVPAGAGGATTPPPRGPSEPTVARPPAPLAAPVARKVPGTTAGTAGSRDQLVSALVNNPRIKWADAGKRNDFIHGGKGVNGERVLISEKILRIMTRLATTHTFTVSSAISSHPDHVNGAGSGRISPHKTGHGVDFNIIDGVHIANEGAGLRKATEVAQELMQYPASFRPSQVSKPDRSQLGSIPGTTVFADGHHNTNLHVTA